MELKEFQLNAVKSLFEAMDKPVRDIILKSPTGSGKNNHPHLLYAPIHTVLPENGVRLAHSRQRQS